MLGKHRLMETWLQVCADSLSDHHQTVVHINIPPLQGEKNVMPKETAV